jgi:hypothetical protein
MSNLIEYLEKYHVESEFTEIEADFMEKFGVTVKQEDNLLLFKYNMLAAKFTRDITWGCRGHIVRRKENSFEFVCRPFDKFFNQHEGWCPIFDPKEFSAIANCLRFVEKADGTCIPVWYDEEQDRWRVSTLGMISTGQVQDFGITFEDLFWKTINIPYENFVKHLDKSNTYVFELCCPENRILTKYDSPKLFLLSIRNKDYGTYLDPETNEDLILNLNEEGASSVVNPISYFFYQIDIETVDDAKLYVQKASAEVEKYGEYPEGFVIYHGLKPIAKMKNAQYVSLHHVSGGDILHTKNVIIDSFFGGTLDDIYDHLVDAMQEFAESLKDKVSKQFLDVRKALKEIKGGTYETQKDYALAVQKYVDSKYWPFFFQNKELILSGEEDDFDLFTKWISLHYAKFMDYWKGN